MSDEIVTLKLNGTISLAAYQRALSRFLELVEAAREEVSPGEPIEWTIADLEGGSARTDVAMTGGRPDFRSEVRLTIVASSEAARDGRVIPFGPRVSKAASDLVSVVGNDADSLEISTGDFGSTEVLAPVLFPAKRAPSTVTSLGMVKGVVDGLALSKSRIVLFSEPTGRPISCYFSEEDDTERVMLDVCGKRVRLRGDLERDRHTGRILRVRDVTTANVMVIPRKRPSFQRALGVFRVPLDHPAPEMRRAQWDDDG